MNKEKKLEISEDRILTYHLDGIADKKVWLCISWYEDNGSICVMLNTEYGGEEIEYCRLTVNIVPSLPPYAGYIDGEYLWDHYMTEIRKEYIDTCVSMEKVK